MQTIIDMINGDLVTKVLTIVAMANIMLTATSQVLEIASKKFSSEGAGKAGLILASIASGLKKVVDAIGFNPQHKAGAQVQPSDTPKV